MNNYPIAWFIVAIAISFFYVQESSDWILVFLLAVVVAKQVEMLNRLDK